jgi:hypothetical protein
MNRRRERIAVLCLSCVSFAACGGPSERHCGGETGWTGTCALKGIAKLREAELPVPHAVMQAVYEPQPNAQSPNYTPGSVMPEFKILANQEVEFREWIQKNQTVSCSMPQPAPGSCVPENVTLNLPQFAPTGAVASSEIKGCAQIESSSTQDQLPALTEKAEQMPQVFLFAPSSSEANGDTLTGVEEAGKRLVADTSIECIAIVGQISPDEQPQVADERARTIRGLLQGAGVETTRMTTITINQNLFGPGTVKTSQPEKRRVTLRILLKR